jgi:hypothetical protein
MTEERKSPNSPFVQYYFHLFRYLSFLPKRELLINYCS